MTAEGGIVKRRKLGKAAAWLGVILFLAWLPSFLPFSVEWNIGSWLDPIWLRLFGHSSGIETYRIDIGLHHATLAALFVIMAMGLNLSIGFAGLLDLGFIAFVAIGAYIMAIELTRVPLNSDSVRVFSAWWAVIPLCIFGAVLVRVALGATCLRLRGDYLAIVTLGFGEITRVALKNDLFGLTGGPDGIFLSPRVMPEFFSDPEPLYYLAAALALLSCFTLYRWKNSRAGRAWEAVREDEVAAAACGINVFRAKIWAYGLGGVFAGLAGALYALHNTTAHPTDYDFIESVKVVVMVVLGGMGSIAGVAFGSVVFILLLEVLRGLAHYRMLIFGATLVALMVFRPQGLAGRAGK
ncbi:MAG: branched-chain amino acid ABC transporter permease [Candidatus Hydrogenedentota bacterium]|nr:MAG: branched-chain amino acid ABC transporter permease [Candidatus Hydrogenedentota bacterium]